jgi:hypothetical protein
VNDEYILGSEIFEVLVLVTMMNKPAALWLLIHSEDGGSLFLRIVGRLASEYVLIQPKNQ